MVATPANALNLDQAAGVVSWDGTATTSTSAITQHDVLVGGASQAITSVTPKTTGYVLTSNGTGADPTFQPPPVTGILVYYFTNTASSVAGELQQTVSTFSPKTTLPFAGIAAGATELQDWITNAGTPNLSFIPAGTYAVHIHADQTGGSRAVVLYGEIWEATTLGADIAKIGTTGSTGTLGGTEVEYFVDFSLGTAYTMASTASRIKTKIFASGGGTGSNATVNIFVGGVSDSHTELPAGVVDVTNFVPYTGAIKNVDLGSYTLTANSATLTNPLTVANGGTGIATTTAYAPICGGTTATGAFQAASTGLSSSGYVLTSNGAAALPSFKVLPASGFSTIAIQVFAYTGGAQTYTPTTGMKYCIVELWGAGGGGGSCSTNSLVSGAGSGGGGGGYARSLLTAADIGASKTVTIGRAGSGGTPGGNNAGGTGGSSSLSTIMVCGGGVGGTSGQNFVGYGGTGGTVSGTKVSFSVSGGRGGYANGTTPGSYQQAFSGIGGSTYGSPTATDIFTESTASGLSPSGYGCGGVGSAAGTSQSGNGAAGANGYCIIIEYCS